MTSILVFWSYEKILLINVVLTLEGQLRKIELYKCVKFQKCKKRNVVGFGLVNLDQIIAANDVFNKIILKSIATCCLN